VRIEESPRPVGRHRKRSAAPDAFETIADSNQLNLMYVNSVPWKQQ